MPPSTSPHRPEEDTILCTITALMDEATESHASVSQDRTWQLEYFRSAFKSIGPEIAALLQSVPCTVRMGMVHQDIADEFRSVLRECFPGITESQDNDTPLFVRAIPRSLMVDISMPLSLRGLMEELIAIYRGQFTAVFDETSEGEGN